MPAIQTKYKGYNFRSRLEARWAVFFNRLNIEFQYEPEGYALPSGWYLPDFFLPDINGGLWVEVKGGEPTPLEEKLIQELVMETKHSGTIRSGDPMLQMNGHLPRWEDLAIHMYCPPGSLYEDGPVEDAFLGWDNMYMFCICPTCEKPGFEHAGRGERICHTAQCYTGNNKDYTSDHPRVMAAATAARSARFEHGARG